MFKEIIKNKNKELTPCKNESTLANIGKTIKGALVNAGKNAKKALIVGLTAGYALASLVSCSQEVNIPDPGPTPEVVTPEEAEQTNKQYDSYILYINNLTQNEKTDIANVLRSKYNNIVMTNYDEVTGTYSVITQDFCDDQFSPMLKDIQCENGAFSLDRTEYKIHNFHGVSQEQIQYVLDNLIVRNGTINISQYVNKSTQQYYFTIDLRNIIDYYDFERSLKVFEDAGIDVDVAKSRESKVYRNVDKETLEQYYSGTEIGVKAKYTVNGGKFYGMEDLFTLFTTDGEQINPYITNYYNDNIEIQPPSLNDDFGL